MKNKRNVLIAFILICCLCLSIGYAALADDLYVNGNAAVKVVSGDNEEDTDFETNFENEVYWLSASATKENNAVTDFSHEISTDKDTLTVSILDGAFTAEDEVIIITAIIKNDSDDYLAKVSVTTDANADISDTEHFNYQTYWAETQPTGTVKNTDGTVTIPEGGSAYVCYEVELDVAPITNATATFSAQYHAEAVQ